MVRVDDDAGTDGTGVVFFVVVENVCSVDEVGAEFEAEVGTGRVIFELWLRGEEGRSGIVSCTRQINEKLKTLSERCILIYKS